MLLFIDTDLLMNNLHLINWLFLSILSYYSPDDTIGDLKKLIAAQTGTKADKLRLQKWHTIYKDHITLEDYEIHDGMNLELYYN